MTPKAVHGRLYRKRGRAANYDCHDCGGEAKEWSQVHGTDGSDPFNHFVPRCLSCHRKYDYRGGCAVKSPEHIEKLRAAAKRQWDENKGGIREAIISSNIRRAG